MQEKIIIAIDGHSSCGKSTVARQLANRLHYVYIDSGAMYRAVTLHFITNKVNMSNLTDIETALKNLKVEFKHNHSLDRSEIYVNGINVEDEIRQMHIAEKVSEVSKIKKVRQAMVKVQQVYGRNKGIVMDGRDIGTTVFPDAELKIFMTADPRVRAQRRFDELKLKGEKVNFEKVLLNLKQRDHTDSHREQSPLTQAPDAIVLDNSYMNHDEQLQFMLDRVKEKVKSI